MKKIHFLFQGAKLPLDFILILVGAFLAYNLRFISLFTDIKPIQFNLTFATWTYYALIIASFSVIILAINGVYNLAQRNHFFIEIFRVIFSLTTAFLIFIFYGFISRNLFESRFIFFMALGLSILLLIIERITLIIAERILNTRNPALLNQVLLVGDNEISKKLSQYFKKNVRFGYHVAVITKEQTIEKIRAIIMRHKIDDLIVTISDLKTEKINEFANLCLEKAINFKYIPTTFEIALVGTNFEDIEGIPLIEVKRTSLEGWGRAYKRIVDIIVGTLLSIFALPFCLIIALCIKLDSRGPIIARIPHRIGFRGAPFYMLKFRTMIPNADKLKSKLLPLNERTDGGPLFKITNDPRITRFGRILRKSRLDELPQLINVLTGSMSLVGPRPHEINEVKHYSGEHKQVLGVKPGITGLAQISGAHNLAFDFENKLDLYYIEKWSPLLDLKIIAKTIVFMFKDRSAV